MASLTATHGPQPADGALDVSAAALDASVDPPDDDTDGALLEMPLIGTFTGPHSAPRLVSHRQASLFADALSLVEQAHVNPSRRILSLLGMPIGEFFLVEELAEACGRSDRWSFLFSSAPLNLPGGVGSPNNAYAVL